MKFCPQCGAPAPDAAKFCRGCGGAFGPQAAPTPAAPSPPVQAAPPRSTVPPASIAQEDEIIPPPPEHGFAFTWGRDPQGRMQPVAAQPSAGSTDTTAGSGPSPGPPGASPPSAGTLPPAPLQWKFREQTSAWADSIAAKIPNPTIVRAVRGAFLHRDVYRHAAQRAELNNEAMVVAGVIIAAGFLGVMFGGYWSLGYIVRIAVVQLVGWGCAIFAIQAVAKSMHQVDLPLAVWFRALIYAQTPGILSFLPVVGNLCELWSAVCTAAACHDVSGKDTGPAVVLALVGVIAAAVGMSAAGFVLR